MKRLLITGASGLLGLNTVLEAEQQFEVIGLSRSRNIQTSRFEWLTADLTTPGAVESIITQGQPDWIIHCAALTNLDVCESQPELAQRLNAEVPGEIAKAARRAGARMVHISTDAVFDGSKGRYSEKDSPKPLGVYARTKLAGERAVIEANPDCIIARVNMFGWSPSGHRSLAEFFFNNLSKDNPVNGFTDVFFSPLLVNHLAQILLRMLAEELNGLYHVFSSDAISKYHFGLAVAERFGLDGGLISPISVEDSGLKASRSPNLSMETGKLSSALGEQPPSIMAGVGAFHALYQQEYPHRLQALISEIGEELPN